VNYGSELNLLKIATHARNVEYNPKRFPAVTLRIHDRKATGLAFKTDIMNIVGCRTEESAYLAHENLGEF
jgi:transcription initiation factor TFIID TATA-box-binding protein